MDLKIINLQCGYKTKKNFIITPPYEINLNLSHPQILLVIGPNGIGKTTFFKTLAGIIKPIKGKILLNNRDLNNICDLDRAKSISYLPAINHRILYFTVFDYISLGSQYLNLTKKETFEKINEILDFFSLKNKIFEYVHELSDGEFQIVNIARIFIQNTNIIILDEATSHLDKKNRQLFYSFLNLKKNENKLIIISSHFYEEISKFADSILNFNYDNFEITQNIESESIINLNNPIRCKNYFINKKYIIGDGAIYFKTLNTLTSKNIVLNENQRIFILQNNKQTIWLIKKNKSKFIDFNSLDEVINFLSS